MSAETPADVELVPVSPAAAAAVLAGSPPPDQNVPDDYPSEFSSGIAQAAGRDGMVGPFFIRRRSDSVVVGEIGGAFIDDSTVEIGYAVVDSQSGKGYATAAVAELINLARNLEAAARVIAHTPFDRPASGRVLEKAGFDNRGVVEDEHEGEVLKVHEWEFGLR